jgi:hypothetical protein
MSSEVTADADLPQVPGTPQAWRAAIDEQLTARGLQARRVQYEIVALGGERRVADWPEVEAWLAGAARVGAWRYGFAIRDEGPSGASVVFIRSAAASPTRSHSPAG